MSPRRPKLWIAVASLGLVLMVAITEFERTAPGPLSRVHESDPALAGMNDCSACHGGWFESMADACLACHEPVAEHLDTDRGLHGMLLPDEDATRCALCHSEHHGDDFAVLNRASFAQAGVPDPAKFDHELVGFAMQGAHLELKCSECHEHAEAELPPEGALRWMGLEQDCASCHDDPHEGAMALDCTACHGQEAFDVFEPRDHGLHLPLVGGHEALDCTQCHAADGAHSLDALGARGGVPAGDGRSCTACHDAPHHPGFVKGTAWLAEASADMICAHCHRADHTSFREPGLSVDPEQHAQSGFRLSTPHAELDCDACHAGGPESSFEERYPGRTAEACAACHEDPHAGQFALPLADAAECLDCHAREHFTPHLFDDQAHTQFAMPLTGSHAALDCEACHDLAADDATRVFRGTEERCEQCHDDAHRGFFAALDPALVAQLTAAPEGECASCHETTRFDDVDQARFDHGALAGFPIRDAHAQTDCETCHPRAAHPDELGRRFGRVEEHFGVFDGCVTCHDDPHAGAFDLPSLPAFVDGRADCARCHVESSFRVLPRGFDHALWTGYPLEGGHAALDCAACHAPLPAPSPEGRSWDTAAGTDCADCHSDPHAGQFLQDGFTDCAACHRNTRAFTDLRFDHDRDARFPLGDAHREVACAECHESVPWGPLEIVRYKPLDTQCVDCHGLDEALLLRRLEESR